MFLTKKQFFFYKRESFDMLEHTSEYPGEKLVLMEFFMLRIDSTMFKL